MNKFIEFEVITNMKLLYRANAYVKGQTLRIWEHDLERVAQPWLKAGYIKEFKKQSKPAPAGE